MVEDCDVGLGVDSVVARTFVADGGASAVGGVGLVADGGANAVALGGVADLPTNELGVIGLVPTAKVGVVDFAPTAAVGDGDLPTVELGVVGLLTAELGVVGLVPTAVGDLPATAAFGDAAPLAPTPTLDVPTTPFTLLPSPPRRGDVRS